MIRLRITSNQRDAHRLRQILLGLWKNCSAASGPQDVQEQALEPRH